MIREVQHGDVTQVEFASPRSRSMGFTVSAFLVRGMLVDSGFPDAHRAFAVWLARRRPRGVIITHHHEDHAGNADGIAALGVPIWAPSVTLERLRAPAPLMWYRRWCWGAPRALTTPVQAFEPEGLECLAAPGHSDDHHVVWDPETGTVFGADLFLGVKVKVSHPWPRENVRQQIETIRSVVRLRPRRFFDAHRGLVPDAVAQLTTKADWIEDTAARVDALAAEGHSERMIVRRLFGGESWRSVPTGFDYSRRNLVASLLATSPVSAPSRTPRAVNA